MDGRSTTRRTSNVDNIEKYLDCPICYVRFANANPAKALPCQHHICLECTTRIAEGRQLVCPFCKKSYILPPDGPKGLPTSYVVMHMIDDIDCSKSDSGRSAEEALCDLAIYNIEKVHKNADETSNRVENAYESALDTVQESYEKVKAEISSDITSTIQRLQEMEIMLHQEAEIKAAKESERLQSQKAQLNEAINQVAHQCQTDVRTLQASGGISGKQWDEFENQTAVREQTLQNIRDTHKTVSYNMIVVQKGAISLAVGNFDDFEVFQSTSKKGKIDLETEDFGSALPNMRDVNKRQLRRQRACRSVKETQEPIVKSGTEEDHQVVSIPRPKPSQDSHDSHRVNTDQSTSAQVDNQDVRGCLDPCRPPLPIKPKPLVNTARLVKQGSVAKVVSKKIPSQVVVAEDVSPMQPNGLAVSTVGGKIKIVVASGNGIRIFSTNGSEETPRRRMQSNREFSDVCCLPDGTILAAADSLENIIKYNRSGMINGQWIIRNMGRPLAKPVSPFGIVCDNDGRVYISDRGNSCVLVCNHDGKLIHTIGRNGPDDSRLEDPLYLALNHPSQNILYVTDSKKKAIMRYMTDGHFIGKINKEKSYSLQQPFGVTSTPNGHVAVTDKATHTVMVVDSVSGALIKQFGGYGNTPGQFHTLAGIAVVGDKLAVCDSGNYRVQLFSLPID